MKSPGGFSGAFFFGSSLANGVKLIGTWNVVWFVQDR
jgi:hypothetical protein